MTDPLRILVLADSRAYHTERYVTEFRNQGCEVLLASLEDGECEHQRLLPRGPLPQFWYLLARSQTSKLIKSWRPHVINPHFATGYGWLAARANRGRIPLALHLWGSDVLIVPQKSSLHRRKASRAIQAADLVLGDSGFLLQVAGSLGAVRRSRIIPWGIDRQYLRYFNPDRNRSEPVRVLVSRPHEPVYDNEIILRALAPVIDNGQVQLSVPERGSAFAEFKRLAGDRMGKGIQAYPPMARSAYMVHVAEHDIYVSASRSDSSPASMIEAMALGLEIIVADIPGVREWAEGSATVFTAGDANDLRSKVTELLQRGTPDRERLAENHQRVQDSAIFEENVAETIEVFRALVAGESGR
jgi:glycosyltransferase involved in cell wall biosynthesis